MAPRVTRQNLSLRGAAVGIWCPHLCPASENTYSQSILNRLSYVQRQFPYQPACAVGRGAVISAPAQFTYELVFAIVNRMTPDDNRDRLAHYQQVGDGIRGELWYSGDRRVEARHRDEWPEIWTHIDRLVALVERDLPRLAPRTEPLFPPLLERRS